MEKSIADRATVNLKIYKIVVLIIVRLKKAKRPKKKISYNFL